MTRVGSHEKKWGMRLLLFVLSLMVSSGVSAAQPVTGTVLRESSGTTYLLADQKCKKYILDTKTDDAENNVRKLSNGDRITATGLLDSTTCTAVIESIEYVGLKKMLGYWYSNEGIITVRDYSSLSFYPINLKDYHDGKDYRTADPIDYRYSITPSEGREWVVFLSDKNSTLFATIQFIKDTALMRIYDSDNGKIIKTLRLAKWGNLRQ